MVGLIQLNPPEPRAASTVPGLVISIQATRSGTSKSLNKLTYVILRETCFLKAVVSGKILIIPRLCGLGESKCLLRIRYIKRIT